METNNTNDPLPFPQMSHNQRRLHLTVGNPRRFPQILLSLPDQTSKILTIREREHLNSVIVEVTHKQVTTHISGDASNIHQIFHPRQTISCFPLNGIFLCIVSYYSITSIRSEYQKLTVSILSVTR